MAETNGKTRTLGRRNETQAKRMNDFATVDDCVRISLGVFERETARLTADRRANRWPRRFVRWFRARFTPTRTTTP